MEGFVCVPEKGTLTCMVLSQVQMNKTICFVKDSISTFDTCIFHVFDEVICNIFYFILCITSVIF